MQVSDVKHFLNTTVVWNKSKYVFKRYVAWRNEKNGKLHHCAGLLDKNKNSIIEVPLYEVEVIQ